MSLKESFSMPRESLKRKTPAFFTSKYKIFFISLSSAILIILFFIVSLLNLSLFGNLSSCFLNINNWLNHHKLLIILWHILLLISIYIFWGIKVDKEVNQRDLSIKEVKKAKRFRWVIIGSIILIDMLVYI